MQITKMLIANRGEIATRIIRACRVLGISTVLVVSEADKDTLPARLADQKVVIGPPQVATYLNIPRLIQTAKVTGANAIHPGYGFLSEKPELPNACAENGIIFDGPKAAHISQMGDKLVARAITQKLGVPTLPGSEKISSFDEVLKVVAQIGFPIMIKAAAGGGGRGMKIVTGQERDNLQRIFEAASAESKAAFGDGTLFVEKFIANARHIEVQVLGDKYGNAVHLGERDCSTQRRHQKLIEEARAPLISDELRRSLYEAAVKLVQNIAYESAGTVEFIVDQDAGKFYFLEVNTRIQVEHPVTEWITGVDLVQEQINVAAGGEIPFKQEDVRFNGHAIECRINAESVAQGFRPTPGLIKDWQMPQGPGVRVDTHCFSGYRIPIFYDSLIGKLIVHGKDREQALRRMLAALGEFYVDGVSTNIAFMQDVLRTPSFSAGRVSTRLLELEHVI